jgi:transcriptional regulator GlxA family with amidase domain
LHLPRNQLQAAASRRFGQPQRLAGYAFRLDRDPGCDGFASIFAQFLERARTDQAPGAGPVEDFFIERTITALERQGLASEALVVARSVKHAMDMVREEDGPNDAERLATAAGVTARTLRNSFRACLGQSLSAFVQQARLDSVRRQLASGRESRSIQALAEAAGFSSATAFARAYLRCFGESPTRTRARAVRDGGAV